ncbi:hypothetical protein ABKV19_025940 [Rosa sericea]
MAARNSKRGFKRFLEDSAANKVDQGKSGCSYVRSKRFKTMFTRENVEGSDESGSQGIKAVSHFKSGSWECKI